MRDTYLADLAEQVEWESGCVERRIERYRLATTQVRKHCDGTSTRVKAELGDTTPGQRILQELMPPLVEGVEAARQEAIENWESPNTKAPVWMSLIPWLPADKLAFITCRCVLTHRPREDFIGKAASSLGRLIGVCVQQQIEFEMWKVN